MRFYRGACFAGTMILGAALLVTGGCGYKNLPVPPESVVPEAIEDLRYSFTDDGVRLTWTYPVETIKGTNIAAITAFDLYRAEIDVDDYCATCPVPYGEPLELPGGVTTENGQRRTAEFDSGLMRSGYKYFFKVQAKNNWWASSGDSNIVTFVWHLQPAAPEGVVATTDDAMVKLSWQPVTTLQDGSEAGAKVMYQLFRSESGAELEPYGEPGSAVSYTDTKVANGQKYRYQVQSLLQVAGDYVKGPRSEGVTATPYDRVPPAVPKAVNAIQTAAGVKVIWEGSREDDLAGYNIYRRAKNDKTFKKIGMVKAPYTIFEDAGVSDGSRYVYAVTSIDTSEPPNESTKSKEASVRR